MMARRIESPSSINTYNSCPRKYYYTYILKLPTMGNIHTVKGNVVHSVLEHFFEELNLNGLDYGSAEQKFKEKIFSLFVRFWRLKEGELKKLEINETDAAFGIDDCVNMLYRWAELFLIKMRKTGLPFSLAFNKLKPAHKEKYYKSTTLSVQGFVDVIEESKDIVRLMDYKTSSSSYVSDEYLLQLGIYALLYKEVNGAFPQEVGIYFLKDDNGEKILKVTENLLQNAKDKIAAHHKKTIPSDIADYPQNITGLCKWPTGKCAFYEKCFNK